MRKYIGLEKIGLYIYWILKTFIAISIVYSLYRQEWQNAVFITLVFLSTYVPTIIKAKYRLYFPIEFDLFIVSFIFLSLFLGNIHSYYYKFWWWDLYLHTEAGFLSGIFGFIMIYILNAQKNIKIHMKAGFMSVFSYCFAVTLGVTWEIFEFTMDSFTGTNLQRSGIVDTMGDLIVVSIGAAAIAIIGYFWMTNKRKSFLFDRSISKFIKQNQHLFKTKSK
jgi:hypothetical protein